MDYLGIVRELAKLPTRRGHRNRMDQALGITLAYLNFILAVYTILLILEVLNLFSYFDLLHPLETLAHVGLTGFLIHFGLTRFRFLRELWGNRGLPWGRLGRFTLGFLNHGVLLVQPMPLIWCVVLIISLIGLALTGAWAVVAKILLTLVVFLVGTSLAHGLARGRLGDQGFLVMELLGLLALLVVYFSGKPTMEQWVSPLGQALFFGGLLGFVASQALVARFIHWLKTHGSNNPMLPLGRWYSSHAKPLGPLVLIVALVLFHGSGMVFPPFFQGLGWRLALGAWIASLALNFLVSTKGHLAQVWPHQVPKGLVWRMAGFTLVQGILAMIAMALWN